MNILLVDDDEHILNHIFQHLENSDFDFSNIYVATSLQAAQKILKLLPIDILISDIEMPGGSGLDLIEWIHKQEYIISSLLLTSYADFNYAHRAMQLKTTEYLLKPVDFDVLDKSLLATISTIQKEQDNHQNRLYRNYWLDMQSDAKDMFWSKVLKQNTSFPHADYTSLGYDAEDYFLAVRLETSSLSIIEEKWGYSMFEYALKNVILELLTSPFFVVESILEKNGQWVIICQFSRQKANHSSPLEECIKNLLENCKLHMHVNMRAVLGKVCMATEIAENMLEMQRLLIKNFNNDTSLLRLEDFYKPEKNPNVPNMSLWEALLQDGNHEELLESIGKHLNEKKDGKPLSREELVVFRQDITQMVYSFLEKLNIQAYKVFANPNSEKFYLKACNSVQDMETYCALILDKALSQTDIVLKPDIIIDEILEYLDKHFCEDISRHTISNHVYFSPDYVSRLFKKSMGVSLTQYILEKRMTLACNMIESSNMPIKAVSMHVGYTNFSYFAKLFKEKTGYTPIEYRDKHQKII